MSLTLTYAAETSVPVELPGVTPDRLRAKSAAEIERLEILHGNRLVALGELFRVSGDPSDGRIDLEGEVSGVHRIGFGMAGGELHVHGPAGRHLGGEMTGGTIRVEGDTGDWAGCEMKGGSIHVTGSAGHHVGSAYPGSRRGMTDGAILVDGAAGDRVGASMRRGLLAVGGSCGESAGFGMIAGTILVFGSSGPRPGAGMRRGTIGLFGPDPPRLLPTFRRAGRFRPLFLRLIVRELDRLGFPRFQGLSDGGLTLYHGDLLALGKGEVWIGGSGETR
jgi:formylmethanofuran dehydrogenase subunit C